MKETAITGLIYALAVLVVFTGILRSNGRRRNLF